MNLVGLPSELCTASWKEQLVMFLSLSIHFVPARTQSSDNVQIGPTFFNGDNDQSNGGPYKLLENEQLSEQIGFRQISGPPEQVCSRFVEYFFHSRKEYRFGQRYSLQSLTLTSYFCKNIYHKVIYLYFYESIFQDKSTHMIFVF